MVRRLMWAGVSALAMLVARRAAAAAWRAFAGEEPPSKAA
jgi:hypothetical protein